MTCSLVFAGDIAPMRGADPDMFGDLSETIRDAGLAVANLEFPLTGRDTPFPGKIYPQKGTTASALSIAEAGFQAVALATNHMLDHGEGGLLDTLDTIDAAGIAHFGAGRNEAEAGAPLILQRGGLRIGLLAYSSTVPNGFAAGHNQAGINSLRALTAYRPRYNPLEYPGMPPAVDTWAVADDLERMRAAIADVRLNCDAVLVYQHWGASMVEDVLAYQSEVGRVAIDAGASGVFGGHQHVISGVEFYKGSPIVHGMGNFVFDLEVAFFTPATRYGVVFGADITRDGLANCHFIPCATGIRTPVRAFSASEPEGKAITETVSRLSAPLGTRVEVDHGVIRLSPLGDAR